MRFRLRELSLLRQDITQVRVRAGVVRVGLQRRSKMLDGLGELSLFQPDGAEVILHGPGRGIFRQGIAQEAFRRGENLGAFES